MWTRSSRERTDIFKIYLTTPFLMEEMHKAFEAGYIDATKDIDR
jgi:hypothetical protein